MYLSCGCSQVVRADCPRSWVREPLRVFKKTSPNCRCLRAHLGKDLHFYSVVTSCPGTCFWPLLETESCPTVASASVTSTSAQYHEEMEKLLFLFCLSWTAEPWSHTGLLPVFFFFRSQSRPVPSPHPPKKNNPLIHNFFAVLKLHKALWMAKSSFNSTCETDLCLVGRCFYCRASVQFEWTFSRNPGALSGFPENIK